MKPPRRMTDTLENMKDWVFTQRKAELEEQAWATRDPFRWSASLSLVRGSFKPTGKSKEHNREHPDSPHTDSLVSCHTHFLYFCIYIPLSIHTFPFCWKQMAAPPGISPLNFSYCPTQKEDILLHHHNTIITPKKSNINSTKLPPVQSGLKFP